MEALALRPLLAATPRPGTLGRVLARFVLGAFYRRECDVVDAFSKGVVEQLRRAVSPEDVPIFLDQLRVSPKFQSVMVVSAKLAKASRWLRPPRHVAPGWAKLGAPAAHHMALGFAYLDHAFKEKIFEDLGSLGTSAPIADLAYDTSLSLELVETAQKAARATIAMMALGEQLERRSLPPWLVMDLAERFSDGSRAVLQLVALISPNHVSEDVLPMEHRLSPDAMKVRDKDRFDDLPVRTGLPEDEDE